MSRPTMMAGVTDFVTNLFDREGELPWLTKVDRRPKTRKKNAFP